MTEKATQTDTLVGQLVSDRYRVKRKIGEGGMGTVYEAVHEAIEKRIALKVLHSQYSSSPDVVRRFKQEAISASRIKHQNVIDVFDYGQLGDGSCFIAMEYLEGMDLGQALEKRGHFAPAEAIRITLQMCKALGLGHGRGVVHRDLKPENVFLQTTPEGDELVKILDYGIAQLRGSDEPAPTEMRPRRLTKTGMIFGTPEYMAPEQARGQNVDLRSDVYATGVMLYELLTGAVPFLGESFLEVLNQHVQNRVPPFAQANPNVELSEELERAVMRALEKDPDYRYPAMKDFAQALMKTPEGRSSRALISSIRSEEEGDDDGDRVAARIENNIPRSVPGGSTAMFGSVGAPGEDVEIPTHSSKGIVVGIVLSALLALGVGGYFALGEKAPEPVAPVAPLPDAVPTDTIAPEEAPQPAEPHEAPAEVPAAAVREEVVLHVTTSPEGAVVKKDGFQVCDAAPCDVVVKKGEAVTLTAHQGAAHGEAKVLAQKEQAVSIAIRTPQVAPRPRPAPKPSTQAPALCEVMVDGIKILRPCQ